MKGTPLLFLTAAAAGAVLLAGASPPVANAPVKGWPRGWPTFAGGPQHRGQAPAVAQPLLRIRWQTPVDLDPPFAGDELPIHYGSPVVTPRGNVLVTVKVALEDGFRVECRRARDGDLVWTQDLDYSVPPHEWVPPCNPA